MKSIAICLAAAALLAAPAVWAQAPGVDKDALLRKIEKSDSDIRNEKKNTKASVWLTRGDVYYEAAIAPEKDVFEGLEVRLAQALLGPAEMVDTVVGGTPYAKVMHPHVTAFVDQSGLIRSWYPTTVVKPGAAVTAAEAYAEAFKLDPKKGEKAAAGQTNVRNFLLQTASNEYWRQHYATAGDRFMEAYAVSVMQPMNQPDSMAAYNAGLSYVLGNRFAESRKALEVAEQLQYYKEGELFYLMYFADRGLAQETGDSTYLYNAKEMVTRGLAMFPGNSKIIECVTDIYVTLGEDPQSIVPVVKEAIAKDPNNPSLWNGLGRVEESLGNFDGAIEAFEKMSELTPDDFGAWYSIGLLYIKKGDKLAAGLAEVAPEEYETALAEVNDTYAEAVAPLEKAHELNAKEPAIVELLKNVTFRLRERPGMQEKYEKYNTLFKQMQ